MVDSPSGGGVHVRSLVEAFEELGHRVLLVAPDSGGAESMVGKIKGKRWKLVKSLTPDSVWLTARDIYDLWRDRKKTTELIKVIEDFGPDFVFERNAYLQSAGASAALETSVPYFLEIVSPTVEERKSTVGAPLGWYHNWKELERARAANGIIVLSGVVRDILAEEGVPVEKIGVFPVAVNPERFRDSESRGRLLREKLGITGPTVGFVGSIAPYHGVDNLLEATVEIKKELPEAIIWIVGGGEALDGLKSRAREMGVRENVRFEGFVPPDEVPAYMAAFDVAVLPATAYYGSPMKLCEYGAAGVPVIAPRIESVKEMFGEADIASLIGSEDNLAEAILDLLKNREKAENMSRNIHQLVMNRYTWLEVAGAMIEFIKTRIP